MVRALFLAYTGLLSYWVLTYELRGVQFSPQQLGKPQYSAVPGTRNIRELGFLSLRNWGRFGHYSRRRENACDRSHKTSWGLHPARSISIQKRSEDSFSCLSLVSPLHFSVMETSWKPEGIEALVKGLQFKFPNSPIQRGKKNNFFSTFLGS